MADQHRSSDREHGPGPADRPSESDQSSAVESESGAIFDSESDALFEAVDDALVIFDVEHDGTDSTFTFRRNNPVHEELTGMTTEVFRGESLRDILGDDGTSFVERCRDCVENRASVEYDGTVSYPAGPVESRVTLIPVTEAGTVTRIVGVVRECTEHRERKRKLARSKERLEVFFDQAPDGIVVHDVDGNVHDVNETLLEELGYTRAELLSMTVPDFEVGVDEATLREKWASMEVGSMHNVEVRGTHRRKDGSTYPVEVWVSKVASEFDDEPLCMAICRNVSENVEYERELERYKELVENVPTGIYRNTPGPSGEFLEVNPAMVELFDADSAEALLEHNVQDLYADPSERQEFAERLEEHGRVTEAEIELQTLSGERFWGSVTAIASKAEGETYFDGVIQDITERKEIQRALRRREEQFRRLFERHSAPMLLIDPDTGAIRDANEAAIEFYGYSPEEITSMRIQDINQLSAAEVERERKRAEQEDRNRFVFDHELASGEVRTVEVHSSPIEIDEDTILFSIVHDITDQVEYERRLEEQRDDLKVLNEVVRHDIRNDLQLVQAYAEMLDDHVEESGREYLEIVQESALNAIDLTTTARDLARVMLQTDGTEQQLSVDRVIERQIEDLRSTYPDAVVIVDDQLPETPVVANEMLDAVFRNLLTNAIQHNDSDVPEVTITADEYDETVEIRVADNGPGVPDEQKETIFGKGEKGIKSAGTGLGLYLVDTLVDGFGGDVWIEDNEPRGSVFVVELQVADR